MLQTKLRLSGLVAASFAGMLAMGATLPAAAAAVVVQESVPAARGSVAQSPPPRAATQPSVPVDAGTAGGESGRLTDLFYQLQVLQQEVLELRGLVEEQSHQLNRLARDQQEQYLDLDRRMQALRGGAAPARGADEGPGRAADGRSAAGEREAYAAAFELMRQRQFEQSVQAFNQLIRDYPNGTMTANAFYWLGELHLALDDLEQARQWFVQMVNTYPQDQKVPDALYKLGVVYHRLGDVGRAREYLTRVRSQHPQSSAAGLAQTYLAEL